MWEEGFAVFCEGLASNASLIQLDLRNNQINHQGTAELCIALKRNSSLQELGNKHSLCIHKHCAVELVFEADDVMPEAFLLNLLLPAPCCCVQCLLNLRELFMKARFRH